MQTAWRPLDSVTGYFRGVAMLKSCIQGSRLVWLAVINTMPSVRDSQSNREAETLDPFFIQNKGDRTTYKLGAAHSPRNAVIVNARNQNLARAAAFFIWGNCVTSNVSKAEAIPGISPNGGIIPPALRGWNSPGFPFLFFEFDFFIDIHEARLITGKDFEKPRPFLFFQFFLRGLIMADVQKEYGYTAQANNYIEALAKIRIPGEANQCLLVIQRKTWGWNKKKDAISLSQFVEATGICKPHVCRALSILIEMNMIIVTKKNNNITEYTIQKDFDKWKPLPKKVTLPKKVIAITKKGNARILEKSPNNTDITKIEGKKTKKSALPKKVHTKDTRIKPSSTKDTSEKWSPKIKFLVEEYFKTLTEGQQVRFEKQRNKFHSCCDKLLRIDGFSEEEIRKAVNFARHDDFWSQNFLSFLKLRQKDKTGVMYIEVFLNRSDKGKQKNTEAESASDYSPPSKRNKEWLRMIDKNLGKELSVFKKSDLEGIKKKLDVPTYERLLLILKEKNGEQ